MPFFHRGRSRNSNLRREALLLPHIHTFFRLLYLAADTLVEELAKTIIICTTRGAVAAALWDGPQGQVGHVRGA